MKTIISILAAVLILTSCNSGSGGGSGKNNNGGRVGKDVTKDSSKLAKAISGKAYCSEAVYEADDGEKFIDVFAFMSTGGGAYVTLDAGTTRTGTQGFETMEILDSIEFKWGATETRLIINSEELGKTSVIAKISDNKLITTSEAGKDIYNLCGNISKDGTINWSYQTTSPDQTIGSNELIVNKLLCDTNSKDKFVFQAEDLFSGNLEIHIENGDVISGYYQIINENTVMINMMGVSQEATFSRTANDEMVLSFSAEADVEKQNFKVCE